MHFHSDRFDYKDRELERLPLLTVLKRDKTRQQLRMLSGRWVAETESRGRQGKLRDDATGRVPAQLPPVRKIPQ